MKGFKTKTIRLRKRALPGDWHKDKTGRWLILRRVPWVDPPTFTMIQFLDKGK